MSETTFSSTVSLEPFPATADPATRSAQAESKGFVATRHFVERALIDFGLMEAFEQQPYAKRATCILWIAASSDPHEQEDRVSRLLDALAVGGSLVP